MVSSYNYINIDSKKGEFNKAKQKADSVYASSGISFVFSPLWASDYVYWSTHNPAGPFQKIKRYTLATFLISSYCLLLLPVAVFRWKFKKFQGMGVFLVVTLQKCANKMSHFEALTYKNIPIPWNDISSCRRGQFIKLPLYNTHNRKILTHIFGENCLSFEHIEPY